MSVEAEELEGLAAEIRRIIESNKHFLERVEDEDFDDDEEDTEDAEDAETELDEEL
ncbi:hypothetical protein LPW11_11230 [Geomonas sp. RF6]|uniref:hypothetical protein n=1 Tax=Geomonas sp. RF6 TaxID=2897342 RepID=UPI001E4369E7|nr:hypothetical protein [Geomonas sp. RF6]UFS72745.1 hypothetical protein LPW11_11230 [Geomonas sp. RF6]